MTTWIEQPDEIYAALLELHRGLDDAGSRRADARLILLLAAEIGDAATLKRLIAAAREAPSEDRRESPPSAGTPEDEDQR